MMALLIKLRVKPQRLRCDFSSASCTDTVNVDSAEFKMIGGRIGSVCVPSGPVIVTKRCAEGEETGNVGDIEVGGSESVTD